MPGQEQARPASAFLLEQFRNDAPGVMLARSAFFGNYRLPWPEYVTRAGRARPRDMAKATEITDDGLMRRMIAGDEEAFVLLYRRRHPSIYRFALHMCGNTAIAEDVTQEVFMALIRDGKRFDPNRGTLGGFLYGIARNHLRKRWEQDRRLVPLADDEAEPPATNGQSYARSGNAQANGNGAIHRSAPISRDEFATLEAIGRVRQAIATLPENYREVVVLCELEEMSYEEAAAALDCPVGTIRSRLHRARAILVEKLRETRPIRRVSAVGG